MTTNQPPLVDPPNFLFVCTGPNCGERGGVELCSRLKQLLVDQRRWGPVRVVPAQCYGECATGPNACSSRHPELLTGLDPDQPAECLAQLSEVSGPSGAGGATT